MQNPSRFSASVDLSLNPVLWQMDEMIFGLRVIICTIEKQTNTPTSQEAPEPKIGLGKT